MTVEQFMVKVTEGERPAGEVAQGEWPAAKGKARRTIHIAPHGY